MEPIRAEAIRTLYLQLRWSSAAAAIVMVYMVGTAAPFTPIPVIAGWVAVQIVTQIGRELLLRAYRRAQPGDAALDRWALYYTLYMGVAGLVWGSTTLLFAHPDRPITVALTLCGLYGISSGSVPGNAYNPPGLYAFVGLIFSAVLVRLLAIGDFDYAVLGVASAGFGLIMVGFCRVQARTIAEGFRIRFENRALLEALTVEKGQAEDARHKAEMASLSKSQFLAAASHDLRQPLYALSLFSASLDTLRLDAEGRSVVGDIQRSIGTLEQLFEGLLDISRLDAGVVRPRPATVSIDALFDRLSQYHRPVAIERGIDLRLRSDGERVTADPALLEQIVSNLLGNALRYTQRGAVLLAARRRGTKVRVEVWDTGPGIAEADRARIFEEFVQLGNPERDRRKGLGLGLAIARRAAALTGCEVTLVSRRGLGSRFAVELPGSVGAIEVPRGPARTATTALPGLPVLVVDDDRDVRHALADLLTRLGVPAIFAGDGDDALAKLDTGARFALLLADYRLPGAQDGLAIIAAARARQADLPAALVTGDHDPGLVGAADALGVPLLHKPIAVEALRALVGAPAQIA